MYHNIKEHQITTNLRCTGSRCGNVSQYQRASNHNGVKFGNYFYAMYHNIKEHQITTLRKPFSRLTECITISKSNLREMHIVYQIFYASCKRNMCRNGKIEMVKSNEPIKKKGRPWGCYWTL